MREALKMTSQLMIDQLYNQAHFILNNTGYNNIYAAPVYSPWYLLSHQLQEVILHSYNSLSAKIMIGFIVDYQEMLPYKVDEYLRYLYGESTEDDTWRGISLQYNEFGDEKIII